MNDTSVIERGDVALDAAVDGEVVMFHPERGAYFSLGDVGSRIWELVERPIALTDLCATLVAEYDVEPDRCRAEVESFVTSLEGAGLVTIRA